MNEHTRDDLVHRLLEEVSALKEEVARLKGRREAEPASDEPISRRRLLGRAAAAAAGGAGLLIAGAAPAAAGSDGDVVLGGYNDSGWSTTRLTSSAQGPGAATLDVSNSGMGSAVRASCTGGEAGVQAYSSGGSALVAGSTFGFAVAAQIGEVTNTNAAVLALHAGPGPCYYAGKALPYPVGPGDGFVSEVDTGRGIYASSAKGRGGQFAGKKAQVRLTPAGAATHPSSGQAGATLAYRGAAAPRAVHSALRRGDQRP